jgi:hypothetical protein
MKNILLFAVFLALPFGAWAADPVVPDPAKIPALQKIKEQGKDFSFEYLGSRNGMDTWLVHGSGVMQMVYMPANGDAAVIGGLLIGPDGKEIGTELQQQFVSKHPEKAKEILLQARTGQEVAQKETAPPSSKAQDLWRVWSIWALSRSAIILPLLFCTPY